MSKQTQFEKGSGEVLRAVQVRLGELNAPFLPNLLTEADRAKLAETLRAIADRISKSGVQS